MKENNKVYETLLEIKKELESIEINGYIRDPECFNNGLNVAIDLVNRYMETYK